jgi:hypothetical protein
MTYRDRRITAITAKALNAVTGKLQTAENQRVPEQNASPLALVRRSSIQDIEITVRQLGQLSVPCLSLDA